MDIQQAHLFIAFPVPGFNHPDRDKIALLNHLLGSGNHPLLARYMGGKRPLAEGYACRYLSLKRGGALVVHMRSKPEKVGTLKREVVKFLGRLRTFQYSSEDFLEKEQPLVTDFLQAAQNNIRLNSALFRERGLHLARLAARSLLLEDRNIATEDERGILDVTSKDLRTAASKFISGERHAVLMILPNRDQ
jgi:predicted Zn-dependent peptidase